MEAVGRLRLLANDPTSCVVHFDLDQADDLQVQWRLLFKTPAARHHFRRALCVQWKELYMVRSSLMFTVWIDRLSRTRAIAGSALFQSVATYSTRVGLQVELPVMETTPETPSAE